MSSFIIDGLLKLNGIQQFQNDLKNTQNQTESAVNKMARSFSSLAKTVVAAFSVKAIAGFTKSLVSATAQVNASNAQFAATFKEVGDNATKMFNDVSKATGVMATRLRVAGTKAFSQFKGAGLDANSALSETERYLNLASDAAAYYDISLEDADMRLRSFIRGNVEAGDMIGLFTSETQRNSKALEIYGTKYINLAEAQKQMVMLNIADEIYRQSGALGQASRESGEYANQSGNLAESWLQLKAAMGDKILEAAIPIMQSISGIMDDLTDKVKDFNSWIDTNKETITTWINNAKNGLSEFKKNWMTSWDDLRWSVNSFIDRFRPQIETITGFFTSIGEKIAELFGDGTSEVIRVFQGYFTSIKEALSGIPEMLANIADAVLTYLGKVIDWLVNDFYPIAEPYLIGIWNGMKLAVDIAWASVQVVLDSIPSFIENIISTVSGLFEGLTLAMQGDFSGAWEVIKGIFDGWSDFFTGVVDSVKDHFAPIAENLVAVFSGAWEEIKGIFDTWKEFFSDLWTDITATFTDIGSTIANAMGNAFKGVINSVISGIETVINKGVGILNGGIKVINKLNPFGNIDKVEKVELPRLEDGGVTTSETVATIGENGQEAIIPLEKSEAVKLFAERIAAEINSQNASSFGTGSYSALSVSGIHDELYDANKELDEIANKMKDLSGDNEDWRNSTEGINSQIELLNQLFDAQKEKLLMLNQEYQLAVSESGEMGLNARDTKAEIDELVTAIQNTQNAMNAAGTALANFKESTVENKEATTSWIESWDRLNVAIANFFNKSKDQMSSFQTFMSNMGDAFSSVMDAVDAYITPLFNSLQDLQTTYLENEIAELEAHYEELQELNEQKLEDKEESLNEEEKALKDQLYAGKISYADYVKAVEQNEKELSDYKESLNEEEAIAEEELLRKKDELARKQFEANKITQIAQVWIQAATATMTAFAQLGPIAGAVAAALVATTAGVQTATINAQQYTPALARGGIVDEATHALIGEDGAEAIVPLERNTEWVGGLAKALSPAILESERQSNGNSGYVREEIVAFRQMVSEFFDFLRSGNREIVIDGQVVARVISPYVDVEMGRSSRLRARGI